jgi:hypothetical protein
MPSTSGKPENGVMTLFRGGAETVLKIPEPKGLRARTYTVHDQQNMGFSPLTLLVGM